MRYSISNFPLISSSINKRNRCLFIPPVENDALPMEVSHLAKTAEIRGRRRATALRNLRRSSSSPVTVSAEF
ncbi:hypothetical protein CBS147332_4000 [Penicillium roqueforti]|nr:hypothetical protein CBS147332_4000 [Penicillium roqueforti]KAI3108861.1 hypothetical protein CBS147331_5653 [Penicillium roqueforti]